jgi:hypothetical protein
MGLDKGYVLENISRLTSMVEGDLNKVLYTGLFTCFEKDRELVIPTTNVRGSAEDALDTNKGLDIGCLIHPVKVCQLGTLFVEKLELCCVFCQLDDSDSKLGV